MKTIFKYIGACLLAAALLCIISGVIFLMITSTVYNIHELGWMLITIGVGFGIISFFILDIVLD